jgi:hypothetical protein
MTKKRRVEICNWLCEECCRGTRLQWVDDEEVRHSLCIDCIHAREDAEKNEMIESAEREAGEFLRTGGTMS